MLNRAMMKIEMLLTWRHLLKFECKASDIFFRFKFCSVVWKVWKNELHETFVDNDLKNGWLLNFEGQNIDDSGRSLSDIAKPKEKTYIGRECTLVTQKNCCSVSVTVNNNLMTKGNWCFPEKKLSP